MKRKKIARFNWLTKINLTKVDESNWAIEVTDHQIGRLLELTSTVDSSGVAKTKSQQNHT